MIDKNGRIKGKASIIDIILIVAVVVLLVGFVYTRTSDRLGQIFNPNDPMEVIIQGAGLRHFNVNAVNIGDVMFRNHAQHPLGTVVDIEIVPFMNYLHHADGTASLVVSEDRYTIFITLDSVGSIREGIGYFVNGNDHIAPGSEVALISNQVFIPDGRVYSVRRRP